MKRSLPRPLTCLLGLALAGAARGADPAVEAFEKDVRPVLVAECQRCHGPAKQQAGLRLDARVFLLKGGESGPAVAPGDPAGSLLLKAVRHEGGLEMPPGKRLAPAQVAALAAWVKAGATWPAGEQSPAGLRQGPPTEEERRFWSFQPVREPRSPAVRDATWPLTPVDRFVLARLEKEGLEPGADADRRTLLRRVTFDLTGLPPTPEEVASFIADRSPDAFARVVDRLLASPAFGECWGRHWLDVVRYADTAGDGADYPVREAWRYRDWVIAAFNADKPFDRFVREQIAGDLEARAGAAAGDVSPARYAELVTATGYLAMTKRYGYDLKPDFRHLDLADALDNLGQTFLGLSVGCARCHDHKFDPVTSADYYALYGILNSTTFAFPGGEELKRPRNFAPLVPPAEAARRDGERRAALARLETEAKRLEADLGRRQAAAGVASGAAAVGLDGPRAALRQLGDRAARLAEEPPYPVAYGVSEGTPADARLQRRGEPDEPGDLVPRRFLELLGGDRVREPAAGSGRRDLAEWLTRPGNPLTARVFVNRAWHHLFGRGIVATPSDFGTRGARPSHPELLDHLASRFVREGWSVKRLVRTIALSRTYQLASDPGAGGRRAAGPRPADPDNRLLWRHNRRPLDAEAVRDGMLAASGRLAPGSPGGHPFPDVHSWGFTIHEPFQAVYDHDRRSVYLMVQRLRRHPFLGLFDGADPNAGTPDRKVTTTALQSLYLMNSPFVHDQADLLAARLVAGAPADGGRVGMGYEIVAGRPPTAGEWAAAERFLAAYRAKAGDRAAWAAFARVLLTSNAFLFVD